jgi:hypothetical protein
MVVLSELAQRQVQDLGTPEDWACIAQSLGLGDLRPEQRDALWRRLAPSSGFGSSPTHSLIYGRLIMCTHWTA